YADMGNWADASTRYERRVEVGEFDGDVFLSRFRLGVGRAEGGDWPTAVAALIEAWESRPSRLEPLYELVSRLRVRGDYQTAHALALRGLDREPPNDILFVYPWVYRWGLLFEYSITSYWVGELRQAFAACERLLALKELPEAYR